MKIAYKSKKIGNSTVKEPILLTNSVSKTIESIIDYFEQNIGNTEEEIDTEYILTMFSKRIIGRGMLDSITRWFYNLKGLKSEENFSSDQLRIKWYNYMQKHEITWVEDQSDERVSLLTKFAKEAKLGIPVDLIEDTLFSDHKTNFTIQRKGPKPSVETVIQRYNTDVIYYLFSNSKSVSFSINYQQNDKSADLVKNIIRNSKLWGIYVEVEKDDGRFVFNAIGPNELVGQSTKYGKLLYALIYSISPLLTQNTILYLDIELRRNFAVCFPLASVNSLLPVSEAFSQDFTSQYDSEVEEKFSYEFKRRFPQWDIKREIVLIEDNVVFIPDFVIEYRGETVIIEIVGFWTEKYLTKKSKKLKLFSKTHNNIVAFVDESLPFTDIGIPLFKYRKIFPFSAFTTYLQENYEQQAFTKFIEKFRISISETISSVEKSLLNSPFLKENELISLLQVKSKQELEKTLSELQRLLPDSPLFDVFIGYNIIISKSYLVEMHNTLSNLIPPEGISERTLLEDLSIDPSVFEVILRHYDYERKYLTLDDSLILPKSLRRKN